MENADLSGWHKQKGYRDRNLALYRYSETRKGWIAWAIFGPDRGWCRWCELRPVSANPGICSATGHFRVCKRKNPKKPAKNRG